MLACQPAAAAASARSAYEARTLYKAALDDLRRGRTSAFRAKQKALAGYALAPYLEYRYRLRHISGQKLADIEAFEAANPDVPARHHLRKSYLSNLARRGAPKAFLAAWPESEHAMDTHLKCYRSRALHATGRKDAAFEAAEALWLVGKSQSETCDPIFDVWRRTDGFTDDVVWRRIQLAIEARQRKLAQYLLRYLKGTRRSLAETLIQVDANPRILSRSKRLGNNTSHGRYIIQHGISRLARQDAEAADAVWQRYSVALEFSEAERAAVERALLPKLAAEGQFPAAGFTTSDTELVTELAREAVQEANFAQVERFVELLPDNERHQPEWQYWLARALENNHGDNERATLAFQALAQDRHYYGFLAADRLNLPPQLQDRSQRESDSVLAALKNVPAVERAMELFAVGDRLNAAREWNEALASVGSKREQRLLGYAALHLGELRLAISTANRADLTNEVALRFPIGYVQQFKTASAETALPVPLLMAVTRQESAFDRRARSHANARGLMQLLPSTARVVAQRLRESAPGTNLLYQADTNVRLGAHYLAWLSERFNGQIPLVTAAYNAGEHRVDRWIKDLDGMAMDVWIERIPFRETRNYVKNVLAFKQVYTQLLGEPASSTLRQHERAVVGR